MASYLVTGGAGFIGSHLCDALISNHELYVLDDLSSGRLENLPASVHFVKGDVRDYALVEDLISRVDGCFHLAAIVSVPQCNEALLTAHSVNLTGTLNVLQAVHAVSQKKHVSPIPVVFASSCAVYGDHSGSPILETEPTHPISFYAELKLAAEYYARFAIEINHVSVTALRLFNVYGSRQSLDNPYSGVISIFLNNLLHDKACVFYGDGTQSRDFVYVKDVVQFFIQAMQKANGEMHIYNVCTGKCTEIKEVARLLSELTHKKYQVRREAPKLGDIHDSLGSPLLAGKELGIRAKTAIEVGLEELVTHSAKSHPNAPAPSS